MEGELVAWGSLFAALCPSLFGNDRSWQRPLLATGALNNGHSWQRPLLATAYSPTCDSLEADEVTVQYVKVVDKRLLLRLPIIHQCHAVVKHNVDTEDALNHARTYAEGDDTVEVWQDTPEGGGGDVDVVHIRHHGVPLFDVGSNILVIKQSVLGGFEDCLGGLEGVGYGLGGVSQWGAGTRAGWIGGCHRCENGWDRVSRLMRSTRRGTNFANLNLFSNDTCK